MASYFMLLRSKSINYGSNQVSVKQFFCQSR